jgi:5-oxoprolinase (ATP-hydrolysing) subunit A
MVSIDVNADIAEMDSDIDAALMPYISSANIACGFHAGSSLQMAEAVRLCLQHRVAIGAHPSYRDREGFGRRPQRCSAAEIYQLMQDQLGALAAIAQAQQGRLHHVKPHGALYSEAAVSPAVANVIAAAVRDFDSGLCLVGLANSQLIRSGNAIGLRTLAEGFADRRYTDDGLLVPRTQDNALVKTEQEAIDQAIGMVLKSQVRACSGTLVGLEVQTLCVHGDGPHAVAFAHALQKAFASHGIQVAAEQM